jgi:hypothetical protein
MCEKNSKIIYWNYFYFNYCKNVLDVDCQTQGRLKVVNCTLARNLS